MRRLGLLLSLVAMGCATTQVMSSWTDPSASGIHFRKVVVFALAKDPATRRIAEDELVKGSPSGAVVASHTFVSDAELGDVEAVKRKVQEEGFDGAVVMRTVGTQTRQTVVPGAPVAPFGAPYTSLWGYYGYGYPGAYAPDSVRTDRYVEIETLVYAVPDQKLLFGARSETMNPASVNELVDDVAKAVRQELRDQGLIP